MTKSARIRAFLLLLPLFFLHEAARGQGPRGSITGLVTDSTGAVIAGAKVIVTNTSTAVKTSTATNETGYYNIPYLNPGLYSVSVESRGFRTVLRNDQEVDVGDRLSLNFKLEPADVQTSIEVTSGSAPLLEAASASVGTVIDRRRITELPLSDGNPMTLELLSAGLMFTNEVMNSQHTFDNGGSSGIRTDGAPGGNTFTIDGVPDTANARSQGGGSPQGGLNVAFMPPAEAVQEFKVETAAFDAQHGHTPGANINVSIRSGTNQVHGAAYEFYRPPELVAQEFFAKRSGLPVQDFSYNRYGGTLGGPVRIPGVYDGRNKTFFFASYDASALDTPSVSLYSIPTLAERGGDFSKLSSIMYDPLSAVQEGSRIRRQPFPNNVIPQGRLSPIGVNYLKYYPQPNQPGLATGENNLLANNSTTDDFNSELGRVDHAFSDRLRSFVTFYRNLRIQTIGAPGWAGTINGINPSSTLLRRGNQGITLDHVYMISPTNILDLRAGATRWYQGDDQTGLGFDQATLGFPASTLALFRRQSYFPQFTVTGFQALSAVQGDFTADNNLFLAPTYTTIRGRHSLRMGYDLRSYRENGTPKQASAGTYAFGTTYTSGPLDNSAAQFGQGLAALLLGLPTGGRVDRSTDYAAQTMYQALFVQDDFKVNARLTLNVGLRYEYESPTTERYNRNVRGFDSTTPSPIEAAVRAAYAANPDAGGLAPGALHVLGGLTFAGANNRNFWQPDRNNIQPRAGFALQVTPNTVLRGGWGVYMVPWIVSGIQQPGFSQATNVTTTLDGGLTFVGNLANPFPFGIAEPVGSNGGLATSIGQGIAYAPLERRNGLSHRWQVGLQRLLPGMWKVEVSYAGTKGYDLAIPINLDSTPAQYLSTSAIRDQTAINFLGTQVANPFAGIAPTQTSLGSSSTVARSTLLLPYPQFSSITAERDTGSSIYHGGELRVERRFQQGYTIQMGFTYSNMREKISMLNNTDRDPEDRISADDRPKRFTLSGIYELPFGRGRHWGNSWGRPLDSVFGGWQLGSVFMAQSGLPLAMGNVYFNGDPHTVQATYSKDGLSTPVFDTTGFYFQDAAVMTNGAIDVSKQRRDSRITLASNIRSLPSYLAELRGPAIVNLDLSMIKTVRIVERLKVQLRGESLNSLNYIQFGAPSLDPTSASFGLLTRTRNPTRQIQFGAKFLF